MPNENQPITHSHTPPKWVECKEAQEECKREDFAKDLANLLQRYSFSATVPRYELDALMVRYGLAPTCEGSIEEDEKCTCTGAYGDGVGRCIKHNK